VLVRRCGREERWAGLWDFPRFVVAHIHGAHLANEIRDNVRRLTGLAVEPGERLATLRHGVTRYRITLACHEATVRHGRLRRDAELRWLAPGELDPLPLSTTGRKLSRLLLGEDP
jgi:A/G-specific adenine glycosylase